MTTPQAESQELPPDPGVSVLVITAVLILTVLTTLLLNEVPLRQPETTPAKSASVCPSDEVVATETIPREKAPPVDEWAFDTTPVAYPKSKKYGPGFIEHKGAAAAPAYGMCFPRSPEGALFAATHAAAESLQKQPNTDWAEEFIVKDIGSRSKAIDALTKQDLLVSLGYKPKEIKRVEIDSYSFGGYEDYLVGISIGIRVTDNKDRVTHISSYYALTWEDKDWKLMPYASTNPTKIRLVPNFDGYTSWR